MKVARHAAIIAALIAASLSPAFAAVHHRTVDQAYGYAPRRAPRITIYPARRAWRPYIDFSRYIDPISGMYCENTGWAATCVPPPGGWQRLDCRAAWPFPVCARF